MFITFEGIDFCGKSTQIEMLKCYLVNVGYKVELVREPGGTDISEKIRELLLDKKNSKMFMETEFLLFSASRAQLVEEVIRPKLLEGYIVLCDRFHDSATAYQGFGRGVPLESLMTVHKLAIGDTLPNITFLLDITVEESNSRKAKKLNLKLDRIELSGNDFYERVRNGYLSIASKESRFRIIDSTKPIIDVHNNILSEVKKYLEK
ncbi:MAG: dTMP kinase [Candidatus Woesearchaeota archaeon]